MAQKGIFDNELADDLAKEVTHYLKIEVAFPVLLFLYKKSSQIYHPYTLEGPMELPKER